jgi:predicted Na+-dependent transporter
LQNCYAFSTHLTHRFGATGGPLRPEITIGKAAVACIFFLTGFRTELSDLGHAAKNHKLNAFTQGYNLLVLPPIGWGTAKVSYTASNVYELMESIARVDVVPYCCGYRNVVC